MNIVIDKKDYPSKNVVTLNVTLIDEDKTYHVSSSCRKEWINDESETFIIGDIARALSFESGKMISELLPIITEKIKEL